jgi:uroporphyrinogen decarboxylase
MGLPYQMIEAKGPWFENTIKSQADIDALHIADGNDLDYVLKAIQLAKKGLNNRVPLIGFAGAPWTIMAYMVEGSGSKTFSKAKKMLYQEPELAHQLLEKITQSTINYLKAQINAGADMIQLFDSWAGVLGNEQYNLFALQYISIICDAIQPLAPITVFAKDAHFALPNMAKLNCNTIGLDWTINPQDARIIIGSNKTLQGNADPCLLYADEKTIEAEAKKMVSAFGKQRYIANLGHGLYPDLDKNKVKFFIDCIKSL